MWRATKLTPKDGKELAKGDGPDTRVEATSYEVAARPENSGKLAVVILPNIGERRFANTRYPE